MIKNLLLVCLFVASTGLLKAQDYLISFAGNETVGSVEVQNLTQNTKLTVSAGNTLRLLANVTPTALGTMEAYEQSGLKVFPNPMVESATVDFSVLGIGTTTLEVSDMAGRSVARYTAALASGDHKVQLSGLGKGLYTLSIISNGKILAQKIVVQGSAANSPTISYLGASVASRTTNRLKSASLEQQMQFNIGDRLLMKGSSVNGTKINTVVDIPATSKTVTFAFTACTDGDGNNYGTVKIGNQIWMTENLKTTKYNDGTAIATITDKTAWAGSYTPAYCWYDNDSVTYTNNNYGALYKWAVVNGIKNVAPVGWHVPTDAEWTTLTSNHTGGSLKDPGTDNWSSPNMGATNSSGFTALGSGERSMYGNFSVVREWGNWWSVSGYGAGYALYMCLQYLEPFTYRNNYNLMTGFSIRCVKD